jgi:hypothetical protein
MSDSISMDAAVESFELQSTLGAVVDCPTTRLFFPH